MSKRTAHPRRLWRRPWAVLMAVAFGVVMLAGVAAACLSRMLWGYWFVRPGVDGRVLAATRLVSVTPVVPEIQADGSLELVPAPGPIGPGWPQTAYPGPGWCAAERAAYPHEFDYYLLDRRPLDGLEQRRVATRALPALAAEHLRGLMTLAQGTGWIVPAQPGYTQWTPGAWRYSGGVVYELLDADGEGLMLLTLRGGEVSNDHHAYYELLFDSPGQGTRRLLSARRFYFDVAGIEGMEFPGFFIVLGTLGLVIVVPITGLVLLGRWAARRSAARKGACTGCGYDLTGNTSGLCPECGASAAARASSPQP